MAERQTASLGRGTMGSPRPNARSEKGVQTAAANCPPRLARPTTACCAPFMPPGRGAMRATAVTTRTISQAPKPQRPRRAVSTAPAAVCQISRKPARTRTPPLKANSMSPSTEWSAASRSLRKARRSRVARSVRLNRPGSMLWAAASAASPATPSAASAAPRREIARPRMTRARRSGSSSRRQFRFAPGSGSARKPRPMRVAARPASSKARANSGMKRKRRMPMVSWRRCRGGRDRAGGASLRRQARGVRHRWRRGVRRGGSAPSRG